MREAKSIARGASPAGRADMEAVIARVQSGKIDVSPELAVEVAGSLYLERKYRQAETVCRQIVSARPANADAHNILGVTLKALGDTDEAIASLERAVKLAPATSSFHANLGEVLRRCGRTAEAEQSLSSAIALDPANPQALNNLGIIHFERGEYSRAVELYRSALEFRPAMAEAHNNLGNALRMLGDIDGAAIAYQDALTYRVSYPEAYNNLGTLLQRQGAADEAEHAFKKAIAQDSNYIEAYNNLASFYVARDCEVDALKILGEALKISPRNPHSLLLAAKIQARRSNFSAAERAARIILSVDPGSAEAFVILGQVLHETDRHEESIEALEQALRVAPASPEALNFYGVALKSVGRFDEARKNILKALSLSDSLYGAYANLIDLVDFNEEEALFERMKVTLESAGDPEAEQYLPLHYAYAKALDDRGEHVRALDHYVAGGRMKRAQLDYNEAEAFAFFDAIKAAFPRELFANRSFDGVSDDRLVFIVGMPRSGSTLVEQILASHPHVHGAGEVKHLSRTLGQLRDRFPSLHKYPQMMEQVTPAQLSIVANSYISYMAEDAGPAKRITDKLLTNYFFVGLIHLIFPKARIVHTVRNPIDTCLSGFTKLFKDDMPHSYDLGELGRYYGKYRELMEHWEQVVPEGVMHRVSYEEMVADTEAEAKRLIKFLGLHWNKACLEFYKSERPVKTASVSQVRKPIYKTAVERWKKYGPGLTPLIEALDQAGVDRTDGVVSGPSLRTNSK